MLTSPERAQMTTLASARQSHLGSLNDEVRITVRCLRGLPALGSWQQKAVWSTKARLLLLRILQWGTQTYVVLDNLWDLKSLHRKMLTSPERAQMTTLASARQSHLGSLNDEVRITVRCLRGLPALGSWQQKAVWSTKARLLLLRILQWGTQTYVVLDNLWDLKKSRCFLH